MARYNAAYLLTLEKARVDINIRVCKKGKKARYPRPYIFSRMLGALSHLLIDAFSLFYSRKEKIIEVHLETDREVQTRLTRTMTFDV